MKDIGKKRAWGALRLAVGLLIASVFLFPIYWIFISSAKSTPEITASIQSLWPVQGWHLRENYQSVLTLAPFGRYALNTLYVTVWQMAVEGVTSLLAAYAFARGTFLGKRFFFMLTLGAMMIPITVTFIPLYTMFAGALGWKDTFIGIIAPGCVSAYSIFLLRQAFMGVDQSYVDAARVDGMTKLGVLFRVLVPMCRATVNTMILLSFIGGWNAYFWPKIIANRYDATRVLTIGLVQLRRNFSGMFIENYNQVMAGAFMSILPVLIMFLLFQKYILSGYTRAAMK